MHQVTVDIEQRVAIRPVHHDVALPDFSNMVRGAVIL